MKNVLLLPWLVLMTTTVYPECKILSECKWENLDSSSYQHQKLFNSQWFLAATLTFKKTEKEVIDLDQLELAWNGQHLETLQATLFRCYPEKPFHPFEENVLADGIWDKRNQKLHFNFTTKERLNPIHTFGLVLIIPKNTEETIKQGQFALVQSCLPYVFKEHLEEKKPIVISFKDKKR